MNERMNELSKMLQEGLTEYANSEKYHELLCVMSRFYNYSANNCILIALQCPHASYVAGYTSWRNNFHRQVKRGAKAIRIFSPVKYKKKDAEEEEEETCVGFKSAAVFDISATEQIENMAPVQIGINDLEGNIDNYRQFVSAFEHIAPVSVDYRLFDGSAKGYYDDSNKIIVIQDGMPERQTVKTLIHEISHSIMHTQEQLKDKKKGRDQIELEAESVACIVCEHYGFDSKEYSFPYIIGWGGKEFQEILKDSMPVIQKTASEIISRISDYLK